MNDSFIRTGTSEAYRLLPSSASISYRYMDTRRTPKVHGIALTPVTFDSVPRELTSRPPTEMTMTTFKNDVNTPLYACAFDHMKSVDAIETMRAAARHKSRISKNVNSRWNVFLQPKPPRRRFAKSSADEDINVNCAAHLRPALLTFVCPSHAAALLHVYVDRPIVPRAKELHTIDAIDLAKSMRIPLVVVIY